MFFNNECEINLDKQNLLNLFEKNKLITFKFKFNQYYRKLKNSYINWYELVEQVEKDIPRLDLYIQNKKINNINQIIYCFEYLFDKIKLNNYYNVQSIDDLYKWFLFINQSVFGLTFHILNILFTDTENDIYIIDKTNSEKNITLNFSKNHIRYCIQNHLYCIEICKKKFTKVIKYEYICKLQFECVQYQTPEFIDISIVQIQM